MHQSDLNRKVNRAGVEFRPSDWGKLLETFNKGLKGEREGESE